MLRAPSPSDGEMLRAPSPSDRPLQTVPFRPVRPLQTRPLQTDPFRQTPSDPFRPPPRATCQWFWAGKGRSLSKTQKPGSSFFSAKSLCSYHRSSSQSHSIRFLHAKAATLCATIRWGLAANTPKTRKTSPNQDVLTLYKYFLCM